MSEVELLSPVQEVDFPSEWYPLTAGDHFWFQWRLRAALAQIRAVGLRAEAPLRALEVGGGNGVLRAQLEASTRWSIDLNDLNLPALESAVPGRGRRLYYDVREERKDLVEAYDVVILFDVLEHIDASREFLRAVLRHVRPGGHVLLNVPALPSLYSAYDVAAGHVRRYDKRTLSEELSGTAVEIVDLRYWGLSLIPLLALRKALVSRQQSPGEIIRRGFRPPGALAHAVLRMLMRVETPLLPAPPRGTSLLLAGRKP
ncbi:MAG: class I SAM-dependent methyltransferase [Solirubrobacterales bacterium]|jgi:SAM-dependent methyltransferase